jgi:Rieske Fe-S protein
MPEETSTDPDPTAANAAAPGTEVGYKVVPDAPPDPERRAVVTWLWRLPVLLAAAAGGFGLYEAIRVHFEKDVPAARPAFEPRPQTPVAPLAQFAAPWDTALFVLPGAPAVPALVVRLPGPIPGGLEVPSGLGPGTAHLAGFSRVCTHLGCILDFNRDLDAIDFGFNFTTDHPALTCACHLSVFDPEQAGRAVSGPAVAPLPRVDLRIEQGTVVAVGIERT